MADPFESDDKDEKEIEDDLNGEALKSFPTVADKLYHLVTLLH